MAAKWTASGSWSIFLPPDTSAFGGLHWCRLGCYDHVYLQHVLKCETHINMLVWLKLCYSFLLLNKLFVAKKLVDIQGKKKTIWNSNLICTQLAELATMQTDLPHRPHHYCSPLTYTRMKTTQLTRLESQSSCAKWVGWLRVREGRQGCI